VTLELASFPVSTLAFVDGADPGYRDGVLSIDRAALLAELRADPRLESVDLDVARPGDAVRIVPVHDLIEPRVKVEGAGDVFPGVAKRPLVAVGRGRTHYLPGVAVAECAPLTAFGGVPGWHEGAPFYLDMRGPAALVPFAELILLCVLAVPRPDLPLGEQAEAAWDAALRAALHLAELTRGATPAWVERLETSSGAPDLPRVVYLPLYTSPEHYGGSTEAFGTSIYGLTRLSPPLWLEGTEYMDGVVARCGTWIHQKQPQVLDLLREHGTSVCFAGVIAQRTRWTSERQKRWTAQQTARLARALHADGALVTWDYGGNDFLEVAYTIEACEALGIKTVLMTVDQERPGDPGSFLFMPSAAEAIVTTGGLTVTDAPEPERVIGFEDGLVATHMVAAGERIRPIFGQYDFYGLRNRGRVDF
jgi:glycine reductase